jgi:hypothetical protein
MEPQLERVAAALRGEPPSAGSDIEAFLFGMIDAAERERVAGLIGRERAAARPEEELP